MRLVSVVTSARQPWLITRRKLGEEVVYLGDRRAHLDLGVEQARGADHLLDELIPGLLQLVGARRGAHIDDLVHPLLKLVKRERAVVERARQAEAVAHEGLFAVAVADVHALDLGQAETWDSSTTSSQSLGKYESRFGGGRPRGTR
jgi:hypothetical protein